MWVDAADDADGSWLAGGSYLVARRINMTIEVWDRQPLGDQEMFVGRTKAKGAPLSGGEELTEPDFDMPGSNDQPVIPVDAHVRIVHPDHTAAHACCAAATTSSTARTRSAGSTRGCSSSPTSATPHPLRPDAAGDVEDRRLVEYLKFTGSALFAVPPGVGPGEHVGQALFA